jgi:hypothetical protein
MKERFNSDVSKGSATKAEQHNILFESIISQKTSFVTEKHGKRQKSVRLDFLGTKGVVYLSSDYHIINGDQAPTSNKEGFSACSESVEPTLKSAELTPACSKSARLASQLAKPTASVACSESARPTSQSARLTASAVCSKSARLTAPAAIVLVSAQVGLADSQSAKPTFLVLAATNVSSDGSTPIVDWYLGMKSNAIQIKDMHFSNMINKVENIIFFSQILIWSNYFNLYNY